MDEESLHRQSGGTNPVYVVSGGSGTVAEQLAQTVLAQFPGVEIPVTIRAHVQQAEQLHKIVQEAAKSGGIIVHTLVAKELRETLNQAAKGSGVDAVDLVGPLLTQLAGLLDRQPLGQPGLYRQLREAYFKRIEAIEYAVQHDDGLNPHQWHLADIVVLGVSRAGKTPLCMYMAMQGWKAANLPLVPSVDPPAKLLEIDRSRVVGLTIDEKQLFVHRQIRRRRLGVNAGLDAYEDPMRLQEEVTQARRLYQRLGIAVVNVSDKPIEETAQEIIEGVPNVR